jgi:predicted neutral ceramidase superfamily lipid hydrolase
VAVVHRSGFRSGNSASLDVLEKPHRRFQESKLFEELFEQIVRHWKRVNWRKIAIETLVPLT